VILNLIDLNQSVPSHIFKRGKSYYHNEQVQHMKQKQNKTNTSTFHAEVVGTEIYLVQMEVNDQLDILSSYCDCPYAQKDFCKHQVALCLSILDIVTALPTQVESKVSSIKTVRFDDVLDKNELSEAKIIVQSSINSAKQRGFITYSQSFMALHGAEKIILLIDQYIETSRYQMAVKTGIQTLQPVVKALQFTDDSSGNFGDVILLLQSQIHYAISSGLFSWSSQEKTLMLKQIIKASENKIYMDWSDWKFELLRAGMTLCEDEKLFNLMSLHLQFLETSIQSESGYMSRYELSQLKILQFNLLSIRQDDLAIEKFLQENRYLDDIKEIAIERAIALQNLDEAMDIALAGEFEHSEYPGLVNKWRIHQYKLHKMQNHLEHQKELAFQLVSHGNIEFFNDLNELYNLDEWPDVLDKLLSILNSKHQYSVVYTTILKQENLFSRLLHYCQGNLYDLPEHVQWLKAEYPQETKDLYLQWLYEKASNASNRSKYRQVCREIKTFKKLFGDEATALLVDALQKKYPLRTAFLDELDKMKTNKGL
jgi:hypothetical protein